MIPRKRGFGRCASVCWRYTVVLGYASQEEDWTMGRKRTGKSIIDYLRNEPLVVISTEILRISV